MIDMNQNNRFSKTRDYRNTSSIKKKIGMEL